MSHLPDAEAYPAAPWQLVGQLYLTLFHLRRAADARRPAGVYAAAFVSYDEGSPLTYSELLVARPVRRSASIVDIWVDSPASRAGGRELWAIPKDLCDFARESARRGPLSRTEWSATHQRRPIARARFTDVSRMAPRLPFRGATWQPGIADTGGEERSAPITGRSRVLPCRAHWELAADGPLGWLAGARQLGSVRMADFAMRFG